MRRADRLFHIVQLIRGRRLTTARYLAQRLEVSERTVYRDVADLQVQGVPIEGEAGVGYRLGAGFDLPPMMFTHDEAKALVASVRLAQAWLDHAAASGRKHALAEIDVRNVASWSTLIKRGLNLAGIGFDPNDSSIIYNAHEEIARLPAKRLHGAFNKAARGELYACRTANIEKQQELYRRGYKAVAYNRPQDILIFRRPPQP